MCRYWWGYYPIYDWMAIFSFAIFALMALSLLRLLDRLSRRGAGGRRPDCEVGDYFGLLVSPTWDLLISCGVGIPIYPFGYLPVLGLILFVEPHHSPLPPGRYHARIRRETNYQMRWTMRSCCSTAKALYAWLIAALAVLFSRAESGPLRRASLSTPRVNLQLIPTRLASS